MKAKRILFLLLTLTLAGLGLFQVRRSTQERAQVAVLRNQLEEQARQVQELKAANEQLDRQRELAGAASEQAGSTTRPVPGAVLGTNTALNKLASPQLESGRTNPAGAAFGEVLAKMLRDPDTRSFIRDQQRVMMDQLYGPLLKQMGVTPEEGDKFKELLVDHASKAADSAMSLFGGAGQTNRTEQMAALAAEGKAHEAQIKELLGDTRYAQYKEYQQTAGERMQLNLFRQQAGATATLTDPQVEQLLGIMKEEKQTLSSAGQPVMGAGQDSANLQTILSNDGSEQMLGNQEGINLRVYERAKTVLSPEQLTQFGKFQTNQMQMMRMGMSMTKKLLVPDNSAAAP